MLSYSLGMASGASLGINGVSLVVSVVMYVAITVSNKKEKLNLGYLLTLIVTNAFAISFDMTATLLQGKTAGSNAIRISFTLSFLFCMVTMMFFSFYQYYSMRQRTYVSDGIYYSTAFVCIGTFLVMAIGTLSEPSWLFTVNADGFVEKTVAFRYLLLVPFGLMVFNLLLAISCGSVINDAELFAWLSYEILPGAVYLTYFITGYFMMGINYAAVTISIILLYTNIHQESVRAAAEMENKLNRSKMQLMVSQMQPHFLYNSLNSIYALIDIDTELAQEAVSTFSDYLRQNINALKSDSPVDFEEELSHTGAYLYLEKMRFGSRVEIDYDLKSKDFKIPPLTVQPLVENAVKHGLSSKEKGGRLKISSSEDDRSYYVIIEDNGMGFDEKSFGSDGKSTHIGLKNVNDRLSSMVGGSLLIKSEPNIGTICTICIPKDNKKML